MCGTLLNPSSRLLRNPNLFPFATNKVLVLMVFCRFSDDGFIILVSYFNPNLTVSTILDRSREQSLHMNNTSLGRG